MNMNFCIYSDKKLSSLPERGFVVKMKHMWGNQLLDRLQQDTNRSLNYSSTIYQNINRQDGRQQNLEQQQRYKQEQQQSINYTKQKYYDIHMDQIHQMAYQYDKQYQIRQMKDHIQQIDQQIDHQQIDHQQIDHQQISYDKQIKVDIETNQYKESSQGKQQKQMSQQMQMDQNSHINQHVQMTQQLQINQDRQMDQQQYGTYNQISKQMDQIIDKEYGNDNKQRGRWDQDQEEYYQIIKKLKDCKKSINIITIANIDKYRQQIQKFRQENTEYQICLIFNKGSISSSEIMRIIDWIDEMGLTNRVGKLYIWIKNDELVNVQIIKRIIRKFKNIYSLDIKDSSDEIDEQIHEQVLEMVSNLMIVSFGLLCDDNLRFSERAKYMIAKYCQKLETRKHLEMLRFKHINITQLAECESTISDLIKQTKDW